MAVALITFTYCTMAESMTKSVADPVSRRTIYLAGGCFWGTERVMQLIPGVVATTTGYANSTVENPTYKQVCTGTTNAAETVKVDYDPSVIDLSTILNMYFYTIDPTSVNKQVGDEGTQYRTGIYYVDEADVPVIEAVADKVASQHDAPMAVEMQPLENFYPAEDYHQDYLMHNPGGYCHVSPRAFHIARSIKPKKYERPSDEKLAVVLTPRQYEVTQHSATEPPFDNPYWKLNEPGIYVDVVTGEPLFSSSDKFESGCGWPAFAKPINDDAIKEVADTTHGMRRVEVRSVNGDSHLGHVFHDGPAARGGLRYCINSASLRFIPESMLEALGYGKYKNL